MAARRPRAALHIVNQQLSAAIHESKGEPINCARPPCCRAGAASQGLFSRVFVDGADPRLLLSPTTGAMSPTMQAIIERGQAAVEAMTGSSGGADDAAARREAEAFRQLTLTRQLLELVGSQQWDAALQVRNLAIACACQPRAPLW